MTRLRAPKPKPYHRAALMSKLGVSALCFARPRAIDLRRATWTLLDGQVTCPRCLAIIAKRNSTEGDNG